MPRQGCPSASAVETSCPMAKTEGWPAIQIVRDEEHMPPEVRRVVDRMSDRDWQSLIVQLGRYTVQKSRRFYWRTGSSGELPCGEMTESIVSKAVVLWLA